MVALGLCLAATMVPAAREQSPPPQRATSHAPPQDGADAWLALAAKAESQMRLDAAMDRLYTLLRERPGHDDAVAARIRLARLLAVSGSLPQAIAQCQLLRDDTPDDHPLHRQALDLATVLVRRLRAAQSPGAAYFPVVEPLASRGMQALDAPRALVSGLDGRLLLLDQGAGAVYLIGQESAAAVASPAEPTAVAMLPGGGVAIVGKTGLVVGQGTGPAARPIPLSGTWGGKARPVRKVRSMAALSDGSLLVVDRDYEGVLRCDPSTGGCAPWGPVGRFRVVRVGPTDWVFLLDDRGQTVRVLDPAQRTITTVGPIVGGTTLEDVEDLAVDLANGVYLLDTSQKRILAAHIRVAPDGRFGASIGGVLTVPQEGDRAIRNPSAVGVSPDGAVIVAGKSSARLVRFR